MLHRFRVIFQVACLFIALYFTTLFSFHYSENSDVQLLAMRNFNNETIDKYPTFSLCFRGTRFHWYNDLEIFNSYSLDAIQYDRMIRGETAERYERNGLNRSYIKQPVFSNNSQDIAFTNYYLKISDFVRSLHFATETKDTDLLISNPDEWNTIKENPMHLSHQTVDKICFSRSSNDSSMEIRLHDLLTIDSSIIWFYNETEMEIFVHYPHQLLRTIGKSKFSASFSHLQSILKGKTPNVLELKLTESKRIRKRHDSREPCNKDIRNYDKYLQQKMAERLIGVIGCVPIYLKAMLSNETDFEVCHSPNKLKEALKIINGFSNLLQDFEPSCDEMRVLSIDSVNHNPIPVPDDIAIKFYYTEKVYEEIQYIQAIAFENWLSNVGGFVGIFLGYSMMQVPEFLLIFANLFDRKRRTRMAGNVSTRGSIGGVLFY